ncbi:hypothetical protein CBM2623_B170046 [Cupriavidus taiwanensis]|nr:hypothetical protein CBM2623_B170046 [Cupriavidus taiwanensis]
MPGLVFVKKCQSGPLALNLSGFCFYIKACQAGARKKARLSLDESRLGANVLM